jgi:probable rRNA maturation factor
LPTNGPNQVSVAADEGYEPLAELPWVEPLALRVLDGEDVSGSALSVLFTNDETVRELNREFRGYDESTDVLSFGLSELAKPAVDGEERGEFVLPPDSELPLGEIVISVPTAERQAAEHGRVRDHELAHLLIHGILHVLGYDHYEPDEERTMREREDAFLSGRPWESNP